MLRGMVTLLLENGQIETTLARAKEVRSMAEKMITLGKKNTLASRRAALAYITKESVVTKLFTEIAPSYADRNGGYTRILKLGNRRGDAAEMAIVALVKDEKAVETAPATTATETPKAEATEATSAEKTPAKKPAAKKTTAKKAADGETAAKKPAAKKTTTAKKAAAADGEAAPAKKPAAKKTTAKKATAADGEVAPAKKPAAKKTTKKAEETPAE
jgi:large subunit ribosomal protein L17